MRTIEEGKERKEWFSNMRVECGTEVFLSLARFCKLKLVSYG